MGLLLTLVRTLLNPLLVILLGLLVSYFAYQEIQNKKVTELQPLLDELPVKQAVLKKTKDEVLKGELFRAERDKKFEELQSLGKKFKEKTEGLPTAPQVSDLIKNIAAIVDRLGLEKISLKPGAAGSGSVEAPGLLGEIHFDLEITGTYIRVMSLIDEITYMKRVARVKKVALSTPVRRQQETLVRAKLQITSYYFEESAKVQ